MDGSSQKTKNKNGNSGAIFVCYCFFGLGCIFGGHDHQMCTTIAGAPKFGRTGVYPYPLGAGSARPNPKKGAPDTRDPSCIGFTVLGGGDSDHGLYGLGRRSRSWVGVDPSLRT